MFRVFSLLRPISVFMLLNIFLAAGSFISFCPGSDFQAVSLLAKVKSRHLRYTVNSVYFHLRFFVCLRLPLWSVCRPRIPSDDE